MTYADVRVPTCLLAVVEPVRTVGGWVVGEPLMHGRGLVVGQREDIAEPAAGVDDGLAGHLGLRAGGEVLDDVGVVLDLRGADAGDVWAGTRERRVEAAGGAVVVGGVDAWAVDALSAVAGDAVIATAVQDGDSHHT